MTPDETIFDLVNNQGYPAPLKPWCCATDNERFCYSIRCLGEFLGRHPEQVDGAKRRLQQLLNIYPPKAATTEVKP